MNGSTNALFQGLLALSLDAVGEDVVGLPDLGDLTTQFLNWLTDDQSTEDQIIDQLTSIQQQLDGITKAISGIAEQIAQFEVLFLESEANSYITNIYNIYSDIQAASTGSPIGSPGSSLADIQSRLVADGMDVIDANSGIRNDVSQLDQVLMGDSVVSQGLLSLQNASLLTQNEFFSYYIGIKGTVLNYFNAYVQALYCVTWAKSMNDQQLLSFPDSVSQLWFDTINTCIANLQNFLDENVPQPVQDIIGALASAGGTPPSIDIGLTAPGVGRWMTFIDMGRSQPVILLYPRPNVCQFQPTVDISNPKLGTQYSFAFGPSGWVAPFFFADDFNINALGIAPPSSVVPSWYMYATPTGSFYLKFSSSPGLPYYDSGVQPTAPSALNPGSSIIINFLQSVPFNSADPRQALTITTRVHALFYRGAGDDAKIYIASAPGNISDGPDWSGIPLAADITTNGPPTAVFNGEELYLFYQGSSDSMLYVAWSTGEDVFDGDTWTSVSLNIELSTTPLSFVVIESGTFLLYRGADGKFYFAGSSGDDLANLKSWTILSAVNIDTSDLIAVTPFQGFFIFFYKGVGDDTSIYVIQTNSAFATWTPGSLGAVMNTSTAPTAITFNGSLYVFYKNADDDDIYSAQFGGGDIYDGSSWTVKPVGKGICTDAAPNAVIINNVLYLFYKEPDPGTNIFVAGTYDGQTWASTGLNVDINTSVAPFGLTFANPYR